jgi:hypothetical protein
MSHDPGRFYEAALGPFETSYCFDCRCALRTELRYVRRGFRLAPVCVDCAVHSGDDNHSSHLKHCRCIPRCL